MTFFAGFDARVSLDGQFLDCTKWTVDDKADEIDVTTTETDGFGQWITGVRDCEVTLELLFNSVGDPLSSAPTITVGNVMHLKLFEHFSLIPLRFWDFPLFLICGISQDIEPRGAVKINVRGRSTDSFTDPGGN